MGESRATVYPADQLLLHQGLDVISADEFPTLDRQFCERVRRSGDRVAYSDYEHADRCWRHYTWNEVARQVACWQAALIRDVDQPCADFSIAFSVSLGRMTALVCSASTASAAPS